MTELASNQFVIIGLPGTGKTSFLAALWYLVQHGDVEHRLTLERMEGDSKHLNEISSLWAGFELVPRTSIGVERTVSMVLTDTIQKKTIALAFPDISGESFRSQWVDRHFTRGYDEFLKGSAGGVLFISPLNIQKPVRIASARPLLKEMSEAGHAHEKDGESFVPWDPTQAPTQVQLVELLQFIAGRDYFKPPFRLALVISAWDELLEGKKPSPAKWLTEELPFLSQFLESNRRLFDFKVYGVSAQGGDYEKDVDELSGMKPSERILIAGDGVKNSHDLTELLTWLMR